MRPHGSHRSPRRAPRRSATKTLATGFGLATVLFTATACSSQELPRLGMPTPATADAERILALWQGSWFAALAVGAVVWGLIIWSCIFHRKRSDELPVQTRYNVPIEVLYTVVPFIIIAVLFYFTVRDQNELIELSDDYDHSVNVVGRQWSWTFNYTDEGVWDAGTPAQRPTLVLPRGERIRFVLTSPDVIHSFWVPAFLYKLDVIPGRVNQFEITPSKEGTFAGKCAELCGVDHSRMLFDVRVVSPEAYDQHIERLKAAGQTGSLPSGIAGNGSAQ
ncbi:MAG: aa3-type cytochrome oxidase subunit II [Dehalococcoidia bacterium]